MIRRWSYLELLTPQILQISSAHKRYIIYTLRVKRLKVFSISFFPRRSFFSLFFWKYFLKIYKNISFWFSYFINFLNIYKFENYYFYEFILVSNKTYLNIFNNFFFLFNQYNIFLILFINNVLFNFYNKFGN